jgi:pimeloyl-ACP methyl ester carboxylesterase
LLVAPVCAQREDDPHYKPVKAVGDKFFAVSAPEGSGVVRYFGTGSLEGDAHAVRALINIHGLLRNADEYERTGEAVIAAAKERGADTLLITPQFLSQIDVSGLGLPANTLRWETGTWLDGYPAVGPAPVSAFSVLDAILERLADRSRFPALREIVVAGHSAGGQLVQRYAIVGRAPEAVASNALAVRFVVANPSSYLYFTPERPSGDGFAPFDAAACPAYNHWKYGVEDPPPYVNGSVAALEARFVTRDVTYLLGLLDIDPNHPVLDKSCSGEAEGPYRLARGEAYVRYLKLRHPSGTAQSTAEVAGVDHDALGMFGSSCGIAVLFGGARASCVHPQRV